MTEKTSLKDFKEGYITNDNEQEDVPDVKESEKEEEYKEEEEEEDMGAEKGTCDEDDEDDEEGNAEYPESIPYTSDEDDDTYMEEKENMENIMELEGDEDELGLQDELEIQEEKVINKAIINEDEVCLCLCFGNCDHALTYLQSLNVHEVTMESIDCVIDNVIRAVKVIFESESEIISAYKVAIVDMFYRVRHEFAFILTCWAFNLPLGRSDQSFRDYGIDSDRTPDLLLTKEGVLFIIEVTAVGSVERGALSKGDENMGFESKYKREIELLNDIGVSNKYFPLVFNMNDTDQPYDQKQMINMSNNFIKSNKNYNILTSKLKKLAIFSTEIKSFLILPSIMLFSKHVPISSNHKNHEFLYKLSTDSNVEHEYEVVTISPNIYKKVYDNWSRFSNWLDRMDVGPNVKVSPVINLSNSKISVEKDPSGVDVNELGLIINNYDRVNFFRCLKLKTQAGLTSASSSDKGIRFYFLNKIKNKSNFSQKNDNDIDKKLSSIRPFLDHACRDFTSIGFDINPYMRYINNDENKCLKSIYYDKDYEDLLLKGMSELNTQDEKVSGLQETDLLAFKDSEKIIIEDVMKDLETHYVDQNLERDTIPVKKLKMKQPFLLPITSFTSEDYCELSYKNKEFLEAVKLSLPANNYYTCKLIEIAAGESYKFHERMKAPSRTYRELTEERIRISNQINKIQKEVYKNKTSDGVLKISKTTDPTYKVPFDELKAKVRKVNRLIEDRGKIEGIKNNIGFVRLPSKGKSALAEEYKKEMEHFKNKKVQSTIEGVGIRDSLQRDYQNDFKVFNNINESLINYAGINPDMFIDYNVSDDTKLLEDLKKIAIDEYKGLIEKVINSKLGHASAFISRLSHSLLFYSQLSFNSDYVRLDNLGYKNVLLMVKGGRKIFKSKSSKIFRLVVPILDETIPWYIEGHSNKGSAIITSIQGVSYLITPWQMLHESILTDCISFYPRICSFVVLNLNNQVDLNLQYHKVCLNVLLAFHNRRQTEVVLANMRYILLSTLGDFTGVSEILKEFFGFNYDCFQSFIRASILYNYPDYFNTFKKLKLAKEGNKDINITDFKTSMLKNIFTKDLIFNTEDLTLMIYSTFLMTKAPYQKLVERANNLKGILKIHKEYSNQANLGMTPRAQADLININLQHEESYSSYAKKLFSFDFNVDLKYCSNVGVFINSHLKETCSKEDIFNKWYSILSTSWDEMATSTGLRGEYDEVEDFWGQKGYFVIYKSLLNNKDFNSTLQSLFFSNNTDDKKRKLLRDMNQTFLEKTDNNREFLIFHAVDKVQWKGSREIYVMDLMTKTLQQPIEKFMGYLCSKLDNELISIPSDRRSQVIHHSIFEKDLPLKDMLTWYLTLDCSKWAPKSVFVKFIAMLLPMDLIPNSFKIHFMNYSEKLFYKRIYFNEPEVNVLKNNPSYAKLVNDFLIYDTKVKGYYLLMPYSWVMGIFNYTSSFLHAANQKYASYLISLDSMRVSGDESTLFMFAHSDDSGGRLTVPNKHCAVRSLILYEVNLKACNHLLSKKKSVVSRIYFEILSIIYMFKQLMALLPKFLGGLRFLPTDKGPCQDMSQSYSKCTEVMIAGASFNVSYIILKVFSMMIWRFYYNQQPVYSDYQRPVQYMGLPDAHPLMVLICGSDSDIIRLMIKNKDTLERVIAFTKNFIETVEEPSPIKPFKFSIQVKNIKKGFEDNLEVFNSVLDNWSVRNVNYNNTAMNCLSFMNKLRDSGFVGSLVNESQVRRFSRSYFMRSQNSLMTRFGLLKISEILDGLRLYGSFTSGVESVKMVMQNILSTEEIQDLNQEILDSREQVYLIMSVLNSTLYSPIRICKFMEQLSMENRRTMPQMRTLKPTVVQLVKSNKIFSVNFDPACLVSFMKDKDMRWALPDVRGLFTAEQELLTFLNKKSLDIDTLSPESLMKICRDFGPKSVKQIYLYSRVPNDLRQIKSYSAFLTYLSINTYDNKEIVGLNVRVTSQEMAVDYSEKNINELIYEVNDIISVLTVLHQKLDFEFYSKLNTNKIASLGWEGGPIKDLVEHLSDNLEQDVHTCYFGNQLNYLKVVFGSGNRNAITLNKNAFYTFLKRQKLKGVWHGKGEVYIMIENKFYSLMLYNNLITEVCTNMSGKVLQHHADYIKDICSNIGIDLLKMSNIEPKFKNSVACYFGFDHSGHLSCLTGRELNTGVPCTIKDYRGDFVSELYNFNLIGVEGNNITLRNDIYEHPIIKKVSFLPIRRSEIFNMVNNLLDKKDFDDKLLNLGLDTFEEFIYTEILTSYGTDNYIDMTDFLDNYTSSKLYSIFKKVEHENLSKITRVPQYSNFPAGEGSLTKILVDYSNHTNDSIVETRKELNSVIMQIRSEYPDQMGVILAGKMVQYFENMFTTNERREISDEYHKISNSEDPKIIRNSIIKLMSYWGYGGLVNSIQNFSMVRSKSNFEYFNRTIINEGNTAQFSRLFEELMSIIFNVMLDWAGMYQGLNFSPKRAMNKWGVSDVISNYIRYTCNSCYGFIGLDRSPDINSIQFNCAMIAFIEDEDFCSSLQLQFLNNYILGCLPISYAYRQEIIVLINTLRNIWCHHNKVNYKPDLTKKVERLPDDVTNWKSLSRPFGVETPPVYAYYNGAISTESIVRILNVCNNDLIVKGVRYRISSKLSNISEVFVPINDFIKFKRPLKAKVLDSDDWADLEIELTSEEPYEETVDELKEILGDIYNKKITKVQNKGTKYEKVFATIKWVIHTMRSCCEGPLGRLRQVGENVILVSTSVLNNNVPKLYNGKFRKVSFTKGETLYCYLSLQDELNNDDFINKLLGDSSDYFRPDELNELFIGKVRDADGVIKDSSQLGVQNLMEIIDSGKLFHVVDGVTEVKEKTVEGGEDIIDDNTVEKSKEIQVFEKIKELKDRGLSKELCDKLQSKFLNSIKDYDVKISTILHSILKEGELNLLLQDLKSGIAKLTSSEYRETFVAPKHFGMAHSMSKLDSKAIKDKKVKAEIESFHEQLSAMIGSGLVEISSNMRRVFEANFKMWKNMTKSTNYKKDNKMFCIMITSSIMSCFKNNEDSSNDHLWQSVINRVSLYITDDPSSDEEDIDIFTSMLSMVPMSRLKYRPKGT